MPPLTVLLQLRSTTNSVSKPDTKILGIGAGSIRRDNHLDLQTCEVLDAHRRPGTAHPYHILGKVAREKLVLKSQPRTIDSLQLPTEHVPDLADAKKAVHAYRGCALHKRTVLGLQCGDKAIGIVGLLVLGHHAYIHVLGSTRRAAQKSNTVVSPEQITLSLPHSSKGCTERQKDKYERKTQ